jgi:hypothetical protein
VGEVAVGHAAQPVQCVVVHECDRLIGQVAAGEHQWLAKRRQQEMV